ncbi:type II secretion system F family protein [bacterium]|nr:type II secretion system F family protein [bacterium]
MKYTSTFYWEALTLDSATKSGSIESSSRFHAIRQLRNHGFYKIKVDQIPRKYKYSSLNENEILSLLNSLLLLLKAGIPLSEVFELAVKENRSVIQKYIFSRLSESLRRGSSLKESFSALKPLFSPFFLSMIGTIDKSGKLIQGLESLSRYYSKKQARSREIQRILRYPKIVIAVALLLTIGVIVFIIPMFENIYLLFGNDLPFLTKIMVKLSTITREYSLIVLGCGGVGIALFLLPAVRPYNPVLRLVQKVRERFQNYEDPFLYSEAMRLLLDNGIPLSTATGEAAKSMSDKNRKYGDMVSQYLEKGYSLTRAFKSVKWFPSSYYRLISSAEKAGVVVTGFEQIGLYLEQKREEQFGRWNKIIEPATMIILGCIIMVILLSIYLPIFDLGNRIG